MKVQTELFTSQAKWEPWKAMAVAAGAGAALMGALVAIITAVVAVVLRGTGKAG